MKSRVLLVLLLAALALAGCGDDDDGDGGFAKGTAPAPEIVAQVPGRPLFEEEQAPGTYVGGVGAQQDPAVAVVVQGEKVVVYVCDGKDFADWFGGAVEGGRFKIESENGTKIEGTVTSERVSGTLAVDGGEARPFSAVPTTKSEPATGLFSFDDPSAPGSKARWIVTRDNVRGLSLSSDGQQASNGLVLSSEDEPSDADRKAQEARQRFKLRKAEVRALLRRNVGKG